MAGGDELRRLADRLAKLPREFVDDAARTVDAAIEDRLLAHTGGDAELSHAPGKLSVNVRKRGTRATITPEGGPQWKWLNEGVGPHLINGRMHPGHPGKGTWDDAVAKPVRKLDRTFDKMFTDAVGG